MAARSDDFDVLTFFIYVMALLTVIVGGFAIWNYKKVSKAETSIKGELRKLKLMEAMAKEEDFQDWVGRDREGKATGGGSRSDFQAMITNGVGRHRLNMKTLTQQSARELRSGGTELTYRISFEGIRVENLVRFLVGLEEGWPGARVKQIVKLDHNERTDAWDAVVDMAIFRSGDENSRG